MTEYVLNAELALPEGHPDLNALENAGATALVDQTLDRVGGAETEDGESIDLVRHWVGGHPQGALLLLVIDAPTLDDAEGGAEAILDGVLEEIEPLEDWRVTKCEVSLGEEEFKQKLANPRTTPGQIEPRSPSPSDDRDMAAEHSEWAERLRGEAKQLRAFSLATFEADRETAETAAGALIWCTSLILEDLFQAHEELSQSGGTAADTDDTVLWQLPERFREHYGVLFVRHMITAAVTVSNRLVEDVWQMPCCVGEALALHMIIDTAAAILQDNAGIEVEEIYEEFRERAFLNQDFYWLYADDPGGAEDEASLRSWLSTHGLDFEKWFEPLPESTACVHPFLLDH
ncbi:hypothetical protein [Glycomyces xiaoerkulensis]|uniref:hypothetical protein n=1 Tax=Glycomyces xiaoerkulensis TaxID=2038139 RepID=UPI000C26A646|nr:hypothetical protein [Glycomyces xiaoerkulensis]